MVTLHAFEPEWPSVDDVDPAATWAECGGLWLTGRPGATPLQAPPGTTRALTAAARRLEALTAALGHRVVVDGPALIGERAAHVGFTRNGAISVGGASRLLQAANGWIAASLPRPEDADLVPAWLGCTANVANPWVAVERAVVERATGEIVDQATLLGVPCAALGEVSPDASAMLVERVTDLGSGGDTLASTAQPATSLDGLIVADLSSLWAGPLCADLLGRAGARVIKVESSGRPDGARQGPPTFFELLHGGHEAVAVDFATSSGRDALVALLERADVVIEASRPRALEQLGIDARRLLATGPRVWLTITAYGREGAGRNRVGFGDDAAVGGGLVASDDIGPCFCGDAIADPATGLFAAVAVLELLSTGGRWLADVALARVAAGLANFSAAIDGPAMAATKLEPGRPRSRRPRGRAPALGEHTRSVLAELDIAPIPHMR